MKKTRFIYGLGLVAAASCSFLAGCGGSSDGRMVLELANVYFENYDGTDIYTEKLNEKFNVKISPVTYTYDGWDGEVNMQIQGNNLTDVIHFNLKSYNFGTTYEKWAQQGFIKPLPDDMSKWPNIKKMLDNISNLDSLKVTGLDNDGRMSTEKRLYCIPLANDITNPDKDFSNFTYVYRRDWAKEIDEANKDTVGYTPIYKEGDVYTWAEFTRLVKSFQKNIKMFSDAASPMVDEYWGFPSITNFYKDVPHCYAKDENGRAINAFTSDKYIKGLEASKDFVGNLYYSQDQFNFAANTANEKYLGGLAGIYYDNFSLSNYIKLRKSFKKLRKDVDLDDGTAFLKIKGPDDEVSGAPGKFALEGTENWFSATMFNYDISEEKQHKILDIMDYLLTEEGTRLAIFGIEDYDYIIDEDDYDYDVNGVKIKLTEQGWEKGADGQYGSKPNGAKYLRYMATLGNDTKSFDPYTEMEAYTIVNDWIKEMQEAKANNMLKVVKTPSDIDWMSTKTKNDKTEALLADANTAVLKYCFDNIKTIDDYKGQFGNAAWNRILEEINEKLGV